MINKVILVGNLGKDPEVRHLENGSVVAKFSVATNERYKDKSGEYQTLTEWHDVVVWRGLAQVAEKLLTKGRLVYIEGKLTHRKWQDKEGNNRYTTEVIGNTLQLLDKKESAGGGNYGNNFPGAADEIPSSQAIPSANPVASNPLGEPKKVQTNDPVMDDDLPF